MSIRGDKYQKYIDEHQLDWINVYDGVFYNNVREKYDVYSTPVIYVLDKNKVIKAKRVAVEQIKQIVNDIESEYKKASKVVCSTSYLIIPTYSWRTSIVAFQFKCRCVLTINF